MLRPTHREKSFKAVRQFTGRASEIAAFEDALREHDTASLHKVMMWHGVGGQGKSTLLREFVRRLDEHNNSELLSGRDNRAILAKIDFDDERLKRIDVALYTLRLQLGNHSGLIFPAFDAAFVSYYRKTRPGVDVEAEFPELFRGEKEALADLLDVIGENVSLAADLASVALPGAGLIYKWGARLTGKLRAWWAARGSRLLGGIENMSPEELLQSLPSFLGSDLCDGIASKPHLRPVVILDTYEALWRGRGQKDGLTDRRADGWVRLLVQDSPGALFVIAGRERLRWREINSAWDQVIESRLLGGLSDEDADEFLRGVPIGEPEIRRRIIAGARQLPFYLDIQVSQYEMLRDSGEQLREDLFGGSSGEILARFLEHMNDGDQSLFRLASYGRTITRDLMDSVAAAFPSRAINYSFDALVSRSAFSEVAEGVYTLHLLLREELQKRELKDGLSAYRNVHRHLFEYHHAWLIALPADLSNDSALRLGAAVRFEAAFDHLMVASSDDAITWLITYQLWVGGLGEWQLVERLHAQALQAWKQNRSRPDRELAILRCNISAALEHIGRYDDAEAYLESALSDVKDIGDNLQGLTGLAHLNLGELLCRREAPADAVREHLVSAVQYFVRLGQPGESFLYVAHIALGENNLQQKKLDDSVRNFAAAAMYAYRCGLPESMSLALHLLAEAYEAADQTSKAIALFHLSLAVPGLSVVDGNSDREALSDEFKASMSSHVFFRSRLASRLADRRMIAGLATMIKDDVDVPLWSSMPGKEGCKRLHEELLLSDYSSDALLKLQSHVVRVAERRELAAVEKLRAIVSVSSVGANFLKSIEIGGFDIHLFDDFGFDFGVDEHNKKLWISAPFDRVAGIEAKIALHCIYAFREVDQWLLDLRVQSNLETREMTSKLHGKAMDCVIWALRFVSEMPEAAREYFTSAVLSLGALKMLETYQAGASQEELFDRYAELWQTWGDRLEFRDRRPLN